MIFDVKIPMEQTIEEKNGKRKIHRDRSALRADKARYAARACNPIPKLVGVYLAGAV